MVSLYMSAKPGSFSVSRFLAATVFLLTCQALAQPAAAQEATLYRDTWGVPHVYSDTEEAGMFALGYAQAEDRLADIYLAVRTAIGRMAEVQGPQMLQQDYLMRLTRNDAIHQEYLAQEAPEQLRRNLNAFVEGVRAYIEEHPDESAEVAIDLEPWHPLAVGRAMILRWPIGTVMGDLQRGKETQKPNMGSNQWAVAPSRSADGSAILLSDPHLTWEGLAVLYEARFHGGDLHMNGYYVIGSPMLGIGHNQSVGWALTTGGPDTSDVYRIQFRLAPAPQYKYDDGWKPVQMESFTIPVKDSSPVIRPAFYTHLGPVISEPDVATGTAFVGASPYFEQTGLYQQFYDMAKAKDVHEFNEALAAHQYNEQNVMSADTQGNIAYVRNGATPIRPEGFDWTRPVDGTTSATAWKGIHPQSDLVRIINPPQGYMQNCNISPAKMMVDSPLTPDRYPPYVFNVSWDSNNPRGKRTVELLHQNDKVTLEDAKAITMDVYDILAKTWQNELREAATKLGQDYKQDAEFQAAVNAILDWDGYFTPEATATVLYKFWRLNCGQSLELAPLGLGQPLPDETRTQILRILRETIDQLKKTYSRWDVPWGEVHVVGRGGQYFPIGGADFSSGDKEGNFSETLFDVKGPPDPEVPGRFVANNGSMAMILMLFNEDGVRSFTCTPWGQSAHPDSPHYMDQGQHLYSKREMKPTWWKKEELMKNLSSTKQLQLPVGVGP
jgi:acyl-homoserine-lactone acylase